ncbi:MAG: bifunctional nuclease family protein [Pseudobdellovibrionaceae bacterium]
MKDLFDFNGFKSQIIFAQESKEEEVFHQKDLVQLFPYGLSITTDAARPFLLLKDEAHQYTLPVAVTPIDAGVSLSQSNKDILQSSPHKFTAMLMQSLEIEIKQAVFVEIKGNHQYIRLYLSGNSKMQSVKLRADEAMSLCLYLGVPLFATKSFIGRSQVMSTEVQNAAQKIQGLGVLEKGSRYLN